MFRPKREVKDDQGVGRIEGRRPVKLPSGDPSLFPLVCTQPELPPRVRFIDVYVIHMHANRHPGARNISRTGPVGEQCSENDFDIYF
jgi:hypothetical protein